MRDFLIVSAGIAGWEIGKAAPRLVIRLVRAVRTGRPA